MSDDYPSVRKALFGDGAVANLYCAVKWVCWHTLHAIIVVVGTLAGAVILAAMVIWAILSAVGRRIAQRVPTTEVSESAATRASRVGGAAKSTPITRRIYNECPVSIKQDPRWYQRLVGVGKGVADRLEPPSTVYLCERCGREYDFNFEPSGCYNCDSTEFEEVRGDRAEDRQAEIRGDDPEITTDGGTDMRFSAQEFATLLEWFMVADPWPLETSREDRIKRMLNEESRERGWNDWVEAYHEFAGGEEDVATDGGQCSTIVGDPNDPAETASLRDGDLVPADFDGPPDPQTVPCPTCGADAGDLCVYFGGGRGDGEPRGGPHPTRLTNARDAGGDGDE